MAKYTVEIHASNNKWTFGNLTQHAADTIKQAFFDGRKFSVTDRNTQKDHSFNPAMLVTMIFSEENSG